MPRRNLNRATLETSLHRLRAGLKNALTLLPGERPEWVVVELEGSYPARRKRRSLFEIPPDLSPREPSLEDLFELADSLAAAKWLKGVVFHLDSLHVSAATAFAIRRAIATVRAAGKDTAAYLTSLSWAGYYAASAAREVVAPESAELHVHGLGVTVTFMRDALARFGVRFERLAIDEYKNAFDGLVRQDMSPAQREQYEALLESFEKHFLETIAGDRGVRAEDVKAWIEEGVSSATRAKELGMLSRVAYEDEILHEKVRPLAEAERFLRVRAAPVDARRVAVVQVLGAIVPGKSRRSPLPVPVVGGAAAGAETLVRALRLAEADRHTSAIVLHVDSPGGSALASDLIWREVRRIRDKKPIVAVMGAVAASGGYYVAAPCNHIVAAPMTVTGSIGVLTGKLVLAGFNEKYGLNAERLQRGRFALLHHPSAGFSEDELALVERGARETYDRFVRRVAEGRKMTAEKVNELGRGHVYSGTDAKALGLVDEIGDIELGIERARELAGIHRTAAVWTVKAPGHLILPSAEDPTTIERSLAPWLRETTWLLWPAGLAWTA